MHDCMCRYIRVSVLIIIGNSTSQILHKTMLRSLDSDVNFHYSPHFTSCHQFLHAILVYKITCSYMPVFVTLSFLTDKDPGLGRNV